MENNELGTGSDIEQQVMSHCVLEVTRVVERHQEAIKAIIEHRVLQREGLRPMVIGAARRMYDTVIIMNGSPEKALEAALQSNGQIDPNEALHRLNDLARQLLNDESVPQSEWRWN